MGIFFSWIIFSFVAGFVGSGRQIGFWGAFLLSLILSPIIGLIIALVSKNKEDEAYKMNILKTQQKQEQALKKLSQTDTQNVSIVDELEKLKKLKEDNYISEEEFQSLKTKLINS